MAVTQLTDVIIPDEFTAYQVENSLGSTALSQSGVVANNALIAAQLQAGVESFTVPFWNDLPDVEADITNDDPTILSTPQKITARKQTVRKSFLHASWSEMSHASELSGESARLPDSLVNRMTWRRGFQASGTDSPVPASGLEAARSSRASVCSDSLTCGYHFALSTVPLLRWLTIAVQ